MFKYLMIASVAVVAGLPGESQAQQLSNKVIVNTLKCEAGRVGKMLADNGLPLNARVLVDWKEVQTTTRAGSIGLSLPVAPIGGTGELSNARQQALTSKLIPFNLHPDNLEVCDGVQIDIIADGLGLLECFTQLQDTLREALKQEEGLTGCETTVTVAKKAGVNLRIKALGFDIGPSGSYDSTHLINTAFAAPSYKKK